MKTMLVICRDLYVSMNSLMKKPIQLVGLIPTSTTSGDGVDRKCFLKTKGMYL